MAKNKIITSQGNVQFINSKGKTISMHPMHCYAVYQDDTVSFLFIYMKEYSGQAFFASQYEDLEVDGETYDSIDALKEAIAEAFAKAGAQARTEIVDELPETGYTNTIYLVKKEHGEGYDEYVYNEEKGWQLIGDTDIEFEKYLEKVVFNAYSADTKEKIDFISGAVDDNASDIQFISGAVDTEIANREAADAVISGAVDTLSTNLSNEVQRAQNAEQTLQNNINTANARIDAEQIARASADNAISGAIDSVVSDLASEVSRATAKENEIDSKVDGEISNREAADSVISGAVDSLTANLSLEVQRAQNAESALDSKVNALSGAVDDKQDTLIAGENITIVDNVISSEGGSETFTEDDRDSIVEKLYSKVSYFSTDSVYSIDFTVRSYDSFSGNCVIDDVEYPFTSYSSITGTLATYLSVTYKTVNNTKNFNILSLDRDNHPIQSITLFGSNGSGTPQDGRVFSNTVIVHNPKVGEGKIAYLASINETTALKSYFIQKNSEDLANYFNKNEINNYLENKRVNYSDLGRFSITNKDYSASYKTNSDTPSKIFVEYFDDSIWVIDNNEVRLSVKLYNRDGDTLVGDSVLIYNVTANTFSWRGTPSSDITDNVSYSAEPSSKKITVWVSGADEEMMWSEYYIKVSVADGGGWENLVYPNSQGKRGYLIYTFRDGNNPTSLAPLVYNNSILAQKNEVKIESKANSADVYLKTETSGTTQLNTAFENKQNTLVSGFNIKTINNESILGSGNIDIQGGGSSYTAGDGIDITNDVISVTGKADTSAVTEVSDALTAHTADTTVHVTAAEKTSWNGAATNASNAVTALGGLSLVKLTQAEYDALATKDSNTLYIISD